MTKYEAPTSKAKSFKWERFTISLLDRKIDKEIWEREKILIEKIGEENRKNIYEGLKKIDERIARIEEKLMR